MATIQSKSDKDLLLMVRSDGDRGALDMLSKRHGYPIAGAASVVVALKRLKVPSINAMRRILASNAGVVSHNGSVGMVA